MTFEISQIKNSYLRDIAIIVDDGNGIIEDKEFNIFKEKAKCLLDSGLCEQYEYSEILGFYSQNTNNKNNVSTKQTNSNIEPQTSYLEELNTEISKKLKEKNLEQTDENIKIVTEIIKNKKDLNIQIKIQEAKIKKLKAQNPDEKFDNRKIYSTIAGIVPTGLAGAALGFKIGCAFGPAGMAIGAFIGNAIGAIIGGYVGHTIANATISEKDLNEAQEEINKQIKEETKKLEFLKAEFEKLS